MSERTETCRVCGITLDDSNHSCPRDRSKWKINSLGLSSTNITGKVVTPDAEFIVQWDEDERSLSVLVDDGELRIHPIGPNALGISFVEDEPEDTGELAGDVRRRPCLPDCATTKPFGPPGPAGCDCGAMDPENSG